MTQPTIGIIGLGNMGRGMACSAARAGFRVYGYDPAAGNDATLTEAGVTKAESLAELSRASNCIVLSLPNSAIVESVILGKAGLAGLISKSTLLLDTSTADPNSTRRIAKTLQGTPIRFVDGPVSGGPRAAMAGTMTMLLGGSQDDIAGLASLLDALCAKRVHVGEVGSGHAAKLFNNLLCGLNLIANGEAIRAAKALNLDIEKLFEGINAGSGRSGVSEFNVPNWILNDAFDSGFSMGLMRKDLRLANELLQQADVTAPLSRHALQIWSDSAATLADELDFNHIVKV
ncbi:NAD(P)-dependent oxidoreductase [Paenalcaligenes niemegkensis]|uniref:NAD(P)-dependent oxidoreductase n=1 Tax=Paenalcaligenes niemegkensis TaxID=2895469 RepID=UPI001EE873EE|nr:NAD(P)-dependent oxidoreductase [Paenalcaligenes niemegkensis]MCQ9616186.1 NAD(P)-dependent oxidoreductase [Paenalcaligenes niemegkensis]